MKDGAKEDETRFDKMQSRKLEKLPYSIPPKPMLHSKTLWGTVVAVLGAILTSLGFENPEAALLFLNDGFQLPQDLWPLMMILGWAWKEYGHRVSKQPIKGVISSKD